MFASMTGMFAGLSMESSKLCLQCTDRIAVTEDVGQYVNGIVQDCASSVPIESPWLRMFASMSMESYRLCLQCTDRITVTEDVRQYVNGIVQTVPPVYR